MNSIPSPRVTLSGMKMPIVLLLAGLLVSGCSRETGDAKKAVMPVPVLVGKVIETNIPVRVRAIGNVTPYAKVTIRSQITGQLQAVHFKEGQEVRQGDLLFTIDPRPSEAALEQTRANLTRDEAQLENARIALKRARELFDSKFVSQEEYDNARASMDALQGTVLADRAAITNAVLDLEHTRIVSPVDGVAGAQLVYAGNIVKSPDDQMLIINQIHPIYVSFAVPEQYLTEIRREIRQGSLPVSVTFEGMQRGAPQGDVTFVDNTVDPETGTIQLKATFPNSDNVLWPGQFVQVELTLGEIRNAILVPTHSVQTGQNGEYVFVVKPDMTVELRSVEPGARYAEWTVVSGDLKAGETVVTDGQLNLVPGKPVNIKSAIGANGGTEAEAK